MSEAVPAGRHGGREAACRKMLPSTPGPLGEGEDGNIELEGGGAEEQLCSSQYIIQEASKRSVQREADLFSSLLSLSIYPSIYQTHTQHNTTQHNTQAQSQSSSWSAGEERVLHLLLSDRDRWRGLLRRCGCPSQTLLTEVRTSHECHMTSHDFQTKTCLCVVIICNLLKKGKMCDENGQN